VSASEKSTTSVKLDAIRFLNAFKRTLQRSFALFKGSRLGLFGLTIVLVFAVIGILAPLISPYPRNFEAPDSDRFTVFTYPRDLTLRGLNYSAPVMSPTTPLQADRQGGIWLINYAREGYVFLDFTKLTLRTNQSPFQAGNDSIQFHVSDLPLSPNRWRPSRPCTPSCPLRIRASRPVLEKRTAQLPSSRNATSTSTIPSFGRPFFGRG